MTAKMLFTGEGTILVQPENEANVLLEGNKVMDLGPVVDVPFDPDAHKFWRMRNHGARYLEFEGYCAMGEFKLFDPSNTPIVGGYPTASTEYDGSYTALNTRDGNAATYWCSAAVSSYSSWLQLEFDEPVNVASVSITSPAGDLTYTPTSFGIEWSDDGVTWVVKRRFVTPTWPSSDEERFFDLVQVVLAAAQHWRLFVNETGLGADYTEVSELDWLEDGTPITGGTSTTNKQWDGSYSPAQARDGDVNTYWSSSSGTESRKNAYHATDFGADHAMDTIQLTPRQGGTNYEKAPALFDIENSTDGLAWNIVDSLSHSWADQSMQSFVFGAPEPPQAARRRTLIIS